MKSPKEMDEKVEEYTGYMILGLMCVLIIFVLILLVQFIVGLLTVISMGA